MKIWILLAAKKKKANFFKLVRNIFVRFIRSEKFDMYSRNSGKGIKYFLKVKINFYSGSMYPEKKRTAIGTAQGIFFLLFLLKEMSVF